MCTIHIKVPGTGVVGSYDPPYMGVLKTNLGLLQKQNSLLTSESSPQAHLPGFLMNDSL